MYEQIPNGKSVTVHGLKCWVPPVGFGYHSDPEQAKKMEAKTGMEVPLLERTDIIKRSEKKAEQYWVRPTLPDEINEWREEEIERQRFDPEWQHPELSKIVRREWHRRLYGVWFYNNGEPVYLTGPHYFYLTYWKIDTGYPDYRKIDLDYFYFWAYSYEDPQSLGIIEITKRRNGKTYRAASILYEVISRSAESHGGIQSKTKEDAQDLFQNKLIPSFAALPYFFVPEYDTTKGDIPKEELRFFRTARKGMQIQKKKRPDLKSSITFRDSKAKAYDGRKLKIYIGDESGKVQVDILDRHAVVEYCCRDHTRRIIGKMIITSTVEELGVRYKFDKLWQQSNQYDRQKNGSTKSGLYKIFTPAQMSGRYDVYGNPYVEETIAEINEKRDAYRENAEELNAYIRKEPMTEEEAFYVDSKQCHFNPNTLNYRLSDLAVMRNVRERGNFEWDGGKRDTRVVWVPSPNGRWEICWLFEKPGQSNKVVRKGTRFYPENNLTFLAGCDPFDHDQVQDEGQRSNGASFVLKRHNPNEANHPYNKAFVCKYLYRPELAYMFYEDMIMQCFYFGCPILAENNKTGIIKYFKDRGYEPFLVHLSGYKEPGVPSNTENKITMLEVMQDYVKNYIDKVFYPDLIRDWLKFEITNTQKYDLSMAAGWTLFGDAYSIAKTGTHKLKDITKLLKRYAA